MLLLEVSISFHISLAHTIILFLLPPVSTYYLGFSLILKNREVESSYRNHGPGFRSHFCLLQSSGQAV